MSTEPTNNEPESNDSPPRYAPERGRAAIIGAVRTPLGFFALVVLVVEAVLAVAVGITDGFDRTLLVIGMLALIIALVSWVGIVAIWRPDSLYGRPTNQLTVAVTTGASTAIEVGTTHGLIELDSPRFLVASGPDPFWQTFGNEDAEIVRKYFSKQAVDRVHGLDALGLTDALLNHPYDFVQLLAPVSPDGHLVLGEQALSADAVSNLLSQSSSTSLLVLPSCNSAALAVAVPDHVNMIAATQNLTDSDWARWSNAFYSALSTGLSLSKSFDLARSVSEAPVVLLARKDFKVATSERHGVGRRRQ